MVRGAFITVEGTEGVGKSTSMDSIRECLEAFGKRVFVTREPGGTKLGERIRELILHSRPGSLSAATESLLMYAARSHHVEKKIRPALEQGIWVLCDRFTDATVAYQAAGRGGDRKFLGQLSDAVLRGLTPDLTLLLDAPLAIGFARLANRPLDHFEQESRDFFERVRAEYLAIAAQEPERVRVIDAAQTVEDVRHSLRVEVEEFIRKFEDGHD
jgi:dTMP kinase